MRQERGLKGNIEDKQEKELPKSLKIEIPVNRDEAPNHPHTSAPPLQERNKHPPTQLPPYIYENMQLVHNISRKTTRLPLRSLRSSGVTRYFSVVYLLSRLQGKGPVPPLVPPITENPIETKVFIVRQEHPDCPSFFFLIFLILGRYIGCLRRTMMAAIGPPRDLTAWPWREGRYICRSNMQPKYGRYQSAVSSSPTPSSYGVLDCP